MSLFDDTSPEAQRVLVEGYRRMSPADKLQRVFELTEATRQMARARIVAEYGPNISEREIRLRLAALTIDRQTMIDAFGWDPDGKGR